MDSRSKVYNQNSPEVMPNQSHVRSGRGRVLAVVGAQYGSE